MAVTALEGTRLGGRYRVGAVLGRGGMAEVYDAIDERLGRSVAVKVLRPELAANPAIRRRFESEARAAARLSHPNVVAVYDTGEDAGTPYIVMERLPGETLADRMAAGPVEVGWLRRVAGDVLAALAAAHAAGIIHRDIKPGNILTAPDGGAKVADFGIAKSVEADGTGAETATNMLVGTPAYLAPERIDGRPATFRSDLYAVGVVLYEALTGRKPFAGATPLAVAHAVRSGVVTPIADLRPDLDPTLAAVVNRAMAPAPERRFATAAEMRAALEGGDLTVVVAGPPQPPEPTLVAPLPVEPPMPVARSGAVRPRRRRGVAWVVIGLLALALAAGLAAGAVAGWGGGGPAPSAPSTTSTTPVPTTVTTVAPVTTTPPTTTADTTTAPDNGPGPRGRHKGHGDQGN
jgi:serine/threonine protein kinase